MARMGALDLAPRLIYDSTVQFQRRRYRCAIWEWLAGRHLDYRRDLRRMADALAALHRRTRGSKAAPVSVPNLMRYLRQRISASLASPSSGEVCGPVRQAVDAARSRSGQSDTWPVSFPCLVHNDLVRSNILVVSGSIRLIDWDWALNSSPALDLCGFLSPFVTSWDVELTLSERAVAIFLHRYLRSFDRADARAVMGELARTWDTYNAMVAFWVHHHGDTARPHFRARGFYERAFARSGEISRWLTVQTTRN